MEKSIYFFLKEKSEILINRVDPSISLIELIEVLSKQYKEMIEKVYGSPMSIVLDYYEDEEQERVMIKNEQDIRECFSTHLKLKKEGDSTYTIKLFLSIQGENKINSPTMNKFKDSPAQRKMKLSSPILMRPVPESVSAQSSPNLQEIENVKRKSPQKKPIFDVHLLDTLDDETESIQSLHHESIPIISPFSHPPPQPVVEDIRINFTVGDRIGEGYEKQFENFICPFNHFILLVL